MVAPVVWGGFALAGMVATGWTLRQAEGAADQAAELAKWVAIGGTAYASFQALKSAGVLR